VSVASGRRVWEFAPNADYPRVLTRGGCCACAPGFLRSALSRVPPGRRPTGSAGAA